jgi:hypothetical protein
VPAEDDVTDRFLPLLPLLASLALTAGCGASQPKQSGDENNFEATPTGSASAAIDADQPKRTEKHASASSSEPEELNEAQKTQMEIALRRGGDKAANCASVVPDAARGEAEVKVTFDGKKGRAIDVAVGPPWAGTDAESCIKRSFVGEIIVPFEGQLEVPYTVKLPAKADAPDKGAKGPKGPKKN